MFMVTVFEVPSPMERAVASLAARQGVHASEARTRLAGGFPRIVQVFADPSAANALAAGLRADGFTAGVVDGDTVSNDARRDLARSLAFGPDGLDAELRGNRTRTLAYGSVRALLHGVRTGVATSTEETTVKSFSGARTILTGGLSTHSTKTVTSTKSTEVRETFVYVVGAPGEPWLAVYERSMNYAFLGAARAPSSMANFTTVLSTLRARCPAAAYDARMTRPGGFGLVPLCPPGLDPGAWKSDVAAALVALGIAAG